MKQVVNWCHLTNLLKDQYIFILWLFVINSTVNSRGVAFPFRSEEMFWNGKADTNVQPLSLFDIFMQKIWNQ